MSSALALAPSLTDWLETQLPAALSWLERMVSVNSFTTHVAGVNRVGEVTAECFAELGFEPEFVPSGQPGHGSHLFLTHPGCQGPLILLVTHLDTVFPPEEEAREHFAWEPAPAEGRIYGPGTVDIKGGTVLLWMVLGALQKFAPEVFKNTRWLVAANSAEEVMSEDFGLRTQERCPERALAVLVFEGGPKGPGEWHLVTSRKGRAEYRITAEGRAAHAGSTHADGINAIVGLVDAVKAVAGLTDYAAGLTVNVGRIEGGTVLNRVPHEAHAELEMRAFDPEVLECAGNAVQALRTPAEPTKGQAGVEVLCLGTTPAWPNDEGTQRLYQHWEVAAASLGLKSVSVSRGGLSDANYLCQLGPTLDGLGPSGGNAHCSERSADGTKVPEYVDVGSFAPKAAMNVLAILRLRETCPAGT